MQSNKRLSTLLRSKAISAGLCEKWQQEWEDDTDMLDLIDKFVKGQDFCIEHDFPSVEFIKEWFPKMILQYCNIFVDDKADLSFCNGTVILMGNTDAKIHVRAFETATIYVRHSSHLEIEADEHSSVQLRLYDASTYLIARDESKIRVIDRRSSIL